MFKVGDRVINNILANIDAVTVNYRAEIMDIVEYAPNGDYIKLRYIGEEELGGNRNWVYPNNLSIDIEYYRNKKIEDILDGI